MSEIQWEQPRFAGRTRSNRDYAELAKQLRANPGRWAVVAERGDQTTATRIRQGVLKDFRPAGAFEAVTNSIEGEPAHRRKVYARYVGEAQK